MLPLRFIDRVKFAVERQFVKGAFFQLLLVGLAIGLISLLGGVLVHWWAEGFDDLGAAVWWAFLRLTDPGYLGDDQGTWTRIVSTWLTVSGYVIFLGALVAIMTRWLIALMTNLERGLTPVSYRHHVVILGWSSRTLPLLAKLLSSSARMRRFLRRHDAGRLHLVVLADKVTAQKRHELALEPGIAGRADEVVLRTGTAIDPDALRRVACFDAAAVIIPSDRRSSEALLTADMQTVKAVLSIAAQAREFKRDLPYVVAEIRDAHKRAVMQQAYPGEIELIAGDELLSRLVVQTMRHPGLSHMLREVMVLPDGNEFYLRPVGESETVGARQQRLPKALVLGRLHRGAQGWRAQLNLEWDTPLGSDDLLVLLARDSADTEPGRSTGSAEVFSVQPHAGQDILATQPTRILVLGWNRRLPVLIEELAGYSDRQVSIDVVSVLDVKTRELALENLGEKARHVRVQQLQADYLAEGALCPLELKRYRSVLLPSSDRLATGEEADARVMVGFLQLSAELARLGAKPQIIVELMDPDNQSLLPGDAEILLSPVILSHTLAQAAMQRETRLVLEELFTPGGGEISFLDPTAVGVDAHMSFRRLQQHLAGQGYTALGIQRADSQGHPLQINPARDEDIALQAGDLLVVLAG